MIFYDEKEKVFYLETNTSSYVFGIYRDVLPVHLYFGDKINRCFLNSEIDNFFNRTLTAKDLGNISSENLPLEFSTFGCGDNRVPTIGILHSDGSHHSKFLYNGFEIIGGKPLLKGLPATYAEDGDAVETLIIHLYDEVGKTQLDLMYSVFEEFNAITRSIRVVNKGEPITINNIMSLTLDFYGMPKSDMITLDGTWCRERSITRRKIVHGDQNISSRVGASSAYHNPFMVICDSDASENYGNVYGFSLVYSGNFSLGVEMDAYNDGRVYAGINPFEFSYALENGDSFQTPEVVLTYSSNGLGEMSRNFHSLYRKRLCRGKFRDVERNILINNWEATYFDFDEEKLLTIAKKASQVGIDTLVLDDGWFGKRINDKAGLGDWVENFDRLPNGLKGLAEKINALGMHFGLWFEPEMVNPDSDLYRKHPDWVLNVNGRDNSLVRSQLVLDLTRKEVCDYIIDSVSNILNKANIEYVKWDMNRYMSEAESSFITKNRQGEVKHRYILGLYYTLETITNKFPNVLFESCASGGGRFDPGMLYYMPQTWTSDDSDAVERLKIQYGTSLVYPFSAMGAHVSDCPNHQVFRNTPFRMRCNVASVGQLGFELDLNNCSSEELEIAKQSIIQYKDLRDVFHKGDCYRLRSPFDGDFSAIQFISLDKNIVVLCIDCRIATAYAPNEYIKLEGLEENAIYKLDEQEYSGDYLMKKGYLFLNRIEHKSLILKFVKK